MLEEIKEILCNYGDISKDEIKADTTLIGDMGLDSMDMVDLIVDLEDKFNVEISERDLWEMQTFSDIEEYMKKKLENK